jgi:GST-like protein
MAIDLHFWPTPNGEKISIYLEEAALAYRVIPVDLGHGEQFEPSFLAIWPNNRIPAIVDHAPADGGAPISVFESGAILLYLAEKTGVLWPRAPRMRTRATEWLMWQMGGLGPMMSQANHFRLYAKGKSPYGEERYTREVGRLMHVLDGRLAEAPYLAGEYSIADVACYPWALTAERVGIDPSHFAHVKRWLDALSARPAVQRGMAVGQELGAPVMDDEARHVLSAQQ